MQVEIVVEMFEMEIVSQTGTSGTRLKNTHATLCSVVQNLRLGSISLNKAFARAFFLFECTLVELPNISKMKGHGHGVTFGNAHWTRRMPLVPCS